MKFWPSDLLALSPWRAMTSRSGSGGVDTHDCSFDCHLERCGHRARVGTILTRDVECSAVIGCGAYDWEAQRDVHRILEVKRLDRNQRLVVVHAKRRVIVCPRALMEHGVGGMGPGHSPSFRSKGGNRRFDDFELLAPELAA